MPKDLNIRMERLEPLSSMLCDFVNKKEAECIRCTQFLDLLRSLLVTGDEV